MSGALSVVEAVFVRELRAYFLTPLAYVFIAVFLLAAGAFTFEIGRFFDTNRADLAPFFFFHPWLYLVFLPAIAMRLWAEEARGGSIELLLTLPAPTWTVVVGKFLAAWAVSGVGLALTLPMWLTVNYLGSPDNAAILLAYGISFLMAGGYIALGSAMSALAGNQVAAFVVAVAAGFIFTAAGMPLVSSGLTDAFGGAAADIAASFSLLAHFEAGQGGVLEIRSVLFFVGFIVMWLTLNTLWADARRGG